MPKRQARNGASSPSSNAIWVERTLFLACLAAVALVLASCSWHFLSRAERDLAQEQFDSIAARSLVEAAAFCDRKLHSLIAMALFVGQLHPNPALWPFVSIANYEVLVRQVLQASAGHDMAVAPLVTPQELPAWEDFAYTFYNTTRKPEPFPPDTAVSKEFGNFFL